MLFLKTANEVVESGLADILSIQVNCLLALYEM